MMSRRRQLAEILILALAILLTAVVFARVIPFFLPQAFTDWKMVFYLAGQRPWQIYEAGTWQHAYNNAPWLAWFLVPFALFSTATGLALWLTLSILVTIWGLKRDGADLFTMLLVLCSPGFYRLVVHGQVDAFIYFGFVLLQETSLWRRQMGLLLMAMKPQVLGLGALVHLVHSPQRWQIIAPTAVLTILTFVFYGFWPIHIVQNSQWVLDAFFNISPWPYGIPVGLLLLGIGLWQNNERLGALATLFLTPYVATHSLFPYTAVLMPMLPKKWQILLFILLWAMTVTIS
ncbi:MAG TPA: hypothetical protein PLD25_23985 [Chloroflexota bacterium]|nr:hypothetical protein [Chloroflexota bacterium]